MLTFYSNAAIGTALVATIIAIWYDVRYMRLPHLLTISTMCAGIGLSVMHLNGETGVLDSCLGLLEGLLPLGIVALVYPEKIGFGDAMWLGGIGSLTGWASLAFVVSIASLSSLIFFGILYLFGKRTKILPFGPFLGVSALIILSWTRFFSNNPSPQLLQ